VSGQTPRDLERREVVGPFRAQAERTYANLEAVAAAGGATLRDALQVTVYLRDGGDAAEADAVFAEVLPEPPPAGPQSVLRSRCQSRIDAVFGIRDGAEGDQELAGG
jgi:enamine deaminase RidA (YjgF/YER057c/UK114 family)